MSWVVVTGGAKRLGADICLRLAEAGHSVIVHYNRSEAEAQQTVARCQAFGVQAVAVQGEFSDDEKIALFAQRCLEISPEIHCLVNNVGNYLIKPGSATSISEMKDLYQTNVFAPFLLIQKFLSSLKSVINIGVAGIESQRADTYATAYAMTKSSLFNLTKSLAKELAPHNVRVNMVSPGYLDNSIDLPKGGKELPMKRAATGREVADVVAFILEEGNGYITGQNIEVAGGVRL